MHSLCSLARLPALGLCVISVFASACAPAAEPPAAATNPFYDIGATEYSDPTVKSLSAWTQLDLGAWVATMSEDVAFYFPDGDAGTRTSLIG